MPTRNFQTAYFEDCDKVDAHEMVAHYVKKNYACYRCTVACGKMCEVKEGPYKGARARTEFETVGLLGPNCGISDFAAIVKGNQLCDELGLDTMSAGNAVALTMELFEKGLITKQDTMGIDARFGNPDALLGIIELIAARRGIGDLLAEGMYGVKRARPEWKRFILDVKGMPFAAYDPRGFTGNGLTNGTSNRGACHNVGGWTIRAELQSGKYDRYALEGKAALVKAAQDSRAYVDSIGMCTVVRGAFGFSEAPTGEVLEAVTGYPFTPKLMEIAQRIYCLERVILNREGIRRQGRPAAGQDHEGKASQRADQGQDPHRGDVRRDAEGLLWAARLGRRRRRHGGDKVEMGPEEAAGVKDDARRAWPRSRSASATFQPSGRRRESARTSLRSRRGARCQGWPPGCSRRTDWPFPVRR